MDMATKNKTKLGVTSVKTGKLSCVWVCYNALLHDKEQNLQVNSWQNGEGFTFIRADESEIHIDWDEWAAMKRAIKELGV